MRARAPGKVVVSGAYAVLSGARALVAAVDRFVVADAQRATEFLTPEVRAAIGSERAPWFDASALRDGERKLGLGSSAAILVASLAALELERQPELGPRELARRVHPRARAAHRAAQGGGSGLDVAASAFGGILLATPRADELLLQAVELPLGVEVRVVAATEPASTPALLRAVAELARRSPTEHALWLGRQGEASERAADAVLQGDAEGFLAALRAQCAALDGLGQAAGIPILTPAVRRLARAAEARGAAALPAGAGGGDVALWVSARPGLAPPSDPELSEVALKLGAPGVTRVEVLQPGGS